MRVTSSANIFLSVLERWGFQTSSFCELLVACSVSQAALTHVFACTHHVIFSLAQTRLLCRRHTAKVEPAVFLTPHRSCWPLWKNIIQSAITLGRRLKDTTVQLPLLWNLNGYFCEQVLPARTAHSAYRNLQSHMIKGSFPPRRIWTARAAY